LNGKRWIGKGKEYDKRGELIFEGDYLNGRINGKGKEYNNGQLKFEGDYLNGKKNGKGKEFDKYGNLISEGEYLYNWKIKGKEYTNGKLEFEGEYFFEKRWNGIVYDKNGKVIYELIDGKGKVKELYKNGKIKLEIYFSTDLEIGNGKEYDENGLLKFEGEYLNCKKWNGKGYDTKNNIAYELKDGKGYIKEYYDNGKLKFEGYYLNGDKNGKGKEYNKYGELSFKGKYVNGERKGKGKEYENGQLIFEGEYLKGERNGKGKEYNDYGEVEFEGEYLNGEKI